MAPDFEYFLALKAHDRFGHNFPGVLVLTLPVALLVLWVFHSFVKVQAAALLPQRLQNKVAAYLGEFRFWGPARLAWIVVSILVGIATHVLWDSFTHLEGYPYHHWALLRQSVDVPILGMMPCYKVLQHTSTVLGLVVLSVWLYRWYRESAPRRASVRRTLSPAARNAIVGAGVGLAVAGGFVRALWGIGIPTNHATLRQFIGEVVVTGMALAWWQLVGYGVLSSRRVR